MTVTRPMLRYHGGKWKLAPWLISQFPTHRIYVEAFAGAASVLIRKPRTYGEIFNDLDSEVVNVFRVLQDPSTAAALERRIVLTPFAREEFRRAYEEPTDDVDRAAKMIIRSFMGFGSASMTRMHITGFRSNASRCGSTPAQDWAKWPDAITGFTDRFQGVCVENRDAIAVMAQHDSLSTLHYVDPP
jgi:DNA adenine methylase